jgi:heme oxygenase
MRARTSSLHAEAENTGVLASILSGNATMSAYALYLRNLLPAYQAMEQALSRHRNRPGFGYLSDRSLHRSESILADLDHLEGSRWQTVLPLLPEGNRYAARITRAGDGSGELLLAHAYTRYLGDLSGGQILRGCLIRLFGPQFRATSFTEFPATVTTGAFLAGFRAALDEAGRSAIAADRVVEEAAVAFEMNIRVSADVAALFPPAAPPATPSRRP